MKIGDVVMIKSGGPQMTVEIVYGGTSAMFGYLQAVWFDGGKLRTGNFAVDALVKVEKQAT